jgi:Spy/CpxP family protein refolding chaperone
MKAKSVWMTGAAVVAFVMLSGFRGGGCGRAQQPLSPDEVRDRSEAVMSWFCGEVTCTADQRAKLDVVAGKLVDDGLAVRERHQGKRGEMLAQFAADRMDARALHAKVDERSAEMTRFAHAAVDALVQAHDILTPEQRTKVVAKIKERGERQPEPFGPFGP